MITIERTQVDGWEAAIWGMRNPLNSWARSDSEKVHYEDGSYRFVPGEKDIELMHKLSKSGDDHGKVLRMITVSCDITAPLYWWKEMDTYKVGTVRNSCSTMHKITSKQFEMQDFSCEHLLLDSNLEMGSIINLLNKYRHLWLEGNAQFEPKDKHVWWQLIQLLPSSYNQRATWMGNYQVLRHIYKAREGHKLDEWHKFRNWIERLPFSEIITDKGEEK